MTTTLNLTGRDLSIAVARAIRLSHSEGQWWGPHPSMRGEMAYASATLGLTHGGQYYLSDGLPRFADDMSATMALVRYLRTLPDGFKYNLRLITYSYNRTYAHIGMFEPDSDEYSEGNGEHATEEAICLAAIAVLATTPAPVTDRA